MGVRYQAPDLGRFESRDPVPAHDYVYAADNPVSFYDPSGLGSVNERRGGAPGIWRFAWDAEIEGAPELARFTLAFDAEGNFYGVTEVSSGVGALELYSTGELTMVEGVPLSMVEAQVSAFGWESSVTPTAAGGAGPVRSGLAKEGLSGDGLAKALSRESRLQKGFNKMIDPTGLRAKLGAKEAMKDWGFSSRDWGTFKNAWRDFTKGILMNPEAVISDRLGETGVRGYIGAVNGVRVVVFVYEEGVDVGLYATTAMPSLGQLSAAGLIT